MSKKITDRFDRYIRLVFSKVLPDCTLKPEGVTYLHGHLVTILKRACKESFDYMHTSKPPRVTLMKTDVLLGIQQILPHSLRSFAEEFIRTVLERYEDPSVKIRSKTKKAGLHVAIGRVAVYVRRFVANHQIRHEAFVILAAFLEYLLVEVFQGVKTYLETTLEGTRAVTADIVEVVWKEDRDFSKLVE